MEPPAPGPMGGGLTKLMEGFLLTLGTELRLNVRERVGFDPDVFLLPVTPAEARMGEGAC
jgi:hypothetical protein